jgi:hypothetical protein
MPPVDTERQPSAVHTFRLRKLPTQKAAKIKVRPSTPELQMKQCLDCDPMRDFINSLQQEVKRL